MRMLRPRINIERINFNQDVDVNGQLIKDITKLVLTSGMYLDDFSHTSSTSKIMKDPRLITVAPGSVVILNRYTMNMEGDITLGVYARTGAGLDTLTIALYVNGTLYNSTSTSATSSTYLSRSAYTLSQGDEVYLKASMGAGDTGYIDSQIVGSLNLNPSVFCYQQA